MPPKKGRFENKLSHKIIISSLEQDEFNQRKIARICDRSHVALNKNLSATTSWQADSWIKFMVLMGLGELQNDKLIIYHNLDQNTVNAFNKMVAASG